jgi:CheY-like chemotaxis protein
VVEMSVPDDAAPASALTAHGGAPSESAAEPRSAADARRDIPEAPPTRPSLPPVDPARDLAGALHEVSNALTVVVGWIERARCAEGAGPEVQRALDVAASRAAQARNIVRHAIGAEARPEPEEEVGAVLADALTGVEPELRRAGLVAESATAATLAARRIPRAASVLQILTNLLLNAAALSPRGSLVRLEAAPAASGDRVIFSVTDAGPGVPPERRGSIFHAGVSTRAGGAGIGLRHAAALARSLDGELTLADTPTGARFELSWPLLSPSGRPPAPPIEAPQPETLRAPGDHALRRAMPLAGARILLVEDDEAVVDLLDTALTARGADVVSVRNRRDLEAALATGRFDAALFDISPIEDDVRGALARARGQSDGLRVVMISGTAVALPSLPEGWVAAWVRKPFEVGEILQAIRPAKG